MKLGNIVKKLRLDNNTMILVKEGSAIAQNIQEFIDVLNNAGLANVIVVVGKSLDDVMMFREKELNDLGWYRITSIKRTLAHPPKEEQEKPNEEGDRTSE